MAATPSTSSSDPFNNIMSPFAAAQFGDDDIDKRRGR